MNKIKIIVREWLKKTAKIFLPSKTVVIIRQFLQKRMAKKRLKKRKTLHFEIHLTHHCNLNCTGCSVFSSIADEFFCDVQSIENDLKQIYKLAHGQIDSIFLQGGEPLLHPQLIEILNITRQHFSGVDISILTNGLLLMAQESIFWETCRENNIGIRMTKYPVNLPFDKIETKAKEHNIDIIYWGKSGFVTKTMRKMPLNLSGTESIKTSFELCYRSNSCILLDEGKIYTCNIIPRIKWFNRQFGTKLEISKFDYIDIYSVNSIDEIFDFLHKPVPFCRYCNMREPVYGIKWGKSKKEISEWT